VANIVLEAYVKLLEDNGKVRHPSVVYVTPVFALADCVGRIIWLHSTLQVLPTTRLSKRTPTTLPVSPFSAFPQVTSGNADWLLMVGLPLDKDKATRQAALYRAAEQGLDIGQVARHTVRILLEGYRVNCCPAWGLAPA
jgi:hypothetical protein